MYVGYIKKPKDMKRKEFLSTITGGITATCVACLAAACSKEEMFTPSSTSGSSTTPSTGNTPFTVNLSTELRAVNDFISKSGVIVIRTSAGNNASNFLAVSSACPHAGATVEYNNTKSSFYCSAHGSAFASDGALVTGPATRGLSKLSVEITGSNLVVKT